MTKHDISAQAAEADRRLSDDARSVEGPGDRLRDLGTAESRPRQCRADLHRPVSIGARRIVTRRPDAPGGGKTWSARTNRSIRIATSSSASIRSAAVSARPAPRRSIPETGKAVSTDVPGVVRRGHRARRRRSRAFARNRVAVRDGRRVDGRNDGARVLHAAPESVARPGVDFLGQPQPAVRDRIAFAATRDHSQGSGVERRPLRVRRRSDRGHAARAQARHDHVSLRAGMGSAFRARARNRRSRQPRTVPHRLRSRVVSRSTRQQVHRCVRRQLLLVSVACDGSVRRGRPRRQPGRRNVACAARSGAGDRRRDRLPVPAAPAAGTGRVPEERRART